MDKTNKVSFNPLVDITGNALVFLIAYKLGKKKGSRKAWKTAWKSVERYYMDYKPTAKERTEEMFVK